MLQACSSGRIYSTNAHTAPPMAGSQILLCSATKQPNRSTENAMDSIDTLIIGAGALGLACAARLASPQRSTLVVEAERLIGSHSSSRNSEVIHAGIYYAPGSLKAELCLEGRERLYAAFADAGVQPIVLAGDSHAFWVNELYDNGGERRAVEFGTSAISSPSPGDHVGGLPLGLALQAANPEVKFCDQSAKGFDTGDAASGRIDEGLIAGERVPVVHGGSLFLRDGWPDAQHGKPAARRLVLQECSQFAFSALTA